MKIQNNIEVINPIKANKESGLINLIIPWFSSIVFSRNKIEITGAISEDPGFLNQIADNNPRDMKNNKNLRDLFFTNMENRNAMVKEKVK